MAFKFAAIIQTIQIPISVKSMHELSERRKERKKKNYYQLETFSYV